MLTYWETLIARKSNITVSDSYAALWGKKFQSGYTVETYTGTLPATLQTIEGYLESYKIYGNTVQDGTPSPENPIVPIGCGVRTAQLFEGAFNGSIGSTGGIVYSEQYEIYYAKVEAGLTYTISGGYYVYAYYSGIPSIGISNSVDNTRHFTSQGNVITIVDGAEWIGVRVTSGDKPMLTEGSTAPSSYIPYGYKLPILSNGTEYPIYLGEVETTRRIRKLVLTGEETIQKVGTNAPYAYYVRRIFQEKTIDRTSFICSHIPAVYHYQGENPSIIINSNLEDLLLNIGKGLIESQPSGNTVEGLKEYLATQYAAGTPVTVWYVLAEPETAVVDEPLMKIGDYADTIDSTQAGVQIPTAAGETTISWAGEGLAPSEVELVYKVKR